jgi:hypothetical protein
MINSSINTNTDVLEINLGTFSNLLPSRYNIEIFHKGLYWLYKDNLIESRTKLVEALSNTSITDTHYSEFLSFLGLVEVILLDSDGGLHRCYEAVKINPANPELYLNIAYAEHHLGNRKRCVSAIQGCLKSNPKHYHTSQFYQCVGIRKKERKKTNFINLTMGKLLRKKLSENKKKDCDKLFRDYLSKKINSYIKTKDNNN